MSGTWGGIIFMEAFVSIHMSIFVLFPLATIINRGKKTQIFTTLFILRIIILIFGNIILGMTMAIIDFMAVFFGAFILVPLLGGVKQVSTGGQLRFDEYQEIKEIELLNHGIPDTALIKKKLLRIYEEYIEAKNTEALSKLKRLSSDKLYRETIYNIDLYKEENLTSIQEIKSILDSKIIEIYDSNTASHIEIIIKAELIEYTKDNFGKIISGSEKKSDEKIFKLNYIKKIEKATIVTKRKCDGCGAPIKEEDIECKYCGLSTGIKVNNKDWVLDDIVIIKQ